MCDRAIDWYVAKNPPRASMLKFLATYVFSGNKTVRKLWDHDWLSGWLNSVIYVVFQHNFADMVLSSPSISKHIPHKSHC